MSDMEPEDCGPELVLSPIIVANSQSQVSPKRYKAGVANGLIEGQFVEIGTKGFTLASHVGTPPAYLKRQPVPLWLAKRCQRIAARAIAENSTDLADPSTST